MAAEVREAAPAGDAKPEAVVAEGVLGGAEAEAARAAVEQAEDGTEVRVYDGAKLLDEASELKEKANACVKRSQEQEALKLYEEGLEILGRCAGFPMLKEESDRVTALKAVLHGNTSQCYLKLELWQRAIDSASACVKLDDKNVKAYWRRSQAHEKLGAKEDALADLLRIKKLGGGGLDLKNLETKCEELYEAQISENKAINEVGKQNEDLFKMKERFEEVMEKYDLGDGHAAPIVTQMLVDDDDLYKTIGRVAKMWKMTEKEAGSFTKWIKKGMEMKVIPTPKASPKPEGEEAAPPSRLRHSGLP